MTEAKLIDNFDPIFLLMPDGSMEMGEALYCECGTLCVINAMRCQLDLGEDGEALKEGDTVNLGDKLVRVVTGPLGECYIGEGFDDGKEGARENECEHCMNERDLSKVEPKLPAFFSNPFMNGMMGGGPTVAPYRWKITRDHLYDGDGRNDKGTEGPRNCDPELKTNPKRFVLKDDDGNTYYQGMLYGDYDGFEPLDDFGGPNAGCTEVWMDGAQL